MSESSDLKAKIERDAETIERLTGAVAAEKAATATVVHDLAVKLRYHQWVHNAVRDSAFGLPLGFATKQRGND